LGVVIPLEYVSVKGKANQFKADSIITVDFRQLVEQRQGLRNKPVSKLPQW